jgi:hypothetical protein
MASAPFSFSQVQISGVNVTEQHPNQERATVASLAYAWFSLFIRSSKMYRTRTLLPLRPSGLLSFFSMQYS